MSKYILLEVNGDLGKIKLFKKYFIIIFLYISDKWSFKHYSFRISNLLLIK